MEEEKEKCAICQDDFFISCRNEVPDCIHRYCFQCYFRWTKNKYRSGVHPRCPVCREEYSQIRVKIRSESVLNTIERIVYGQNRRHTPLNQYQLRRLIHSPKWNNLDHFWSRMHLIGFVLANMIVFVIFIDANQPDDSFFVEWEAGMISAELEEHHAQQIQLPIATIDELLKSYNNHIFLMAILVCNRVDN